MADSVWWVGQDGNVWQRTGDVTSNQGQYLGMGSAGDGTNGYEAANASGVGTYINDPNPGGGGGSTAGGGGSTAPAYNPDDYKFLDDQAAQLRGLLGRTDTGLAQGLAGNENQYATQVGGANADKSRQYANYADQRVQQNTGKQSTYDTINKNAGQGYRSLAQIIGRAAGTGSSAFRDLLPNVVGTDTSSKRFDANNTYGKNLAGIDKAQGQYDISFQGVLDDLLRQKKQNEEKLRTGVETQRQGINEQLANNAGQRARLAGGGYDAVKAAQTPFQQAIENSRNTVEGFFNQFQTPFVAKQAVAATPNLNAYNTDRAQINAGQQGVTGNPYEAMLRKRLQGTA